MGWNGSGNASRCESSAPKETCVNRPRKFPYGLFVILLCIAGALLLSFWAVRRPRLPKFSVRDEADVRTTHSIAISTSKIKPEKVVVAPTDQKSIPETYFGSEIKNRSFTTNKAGFVIERIFTADGKSHRKTHYPASPFKHETDRYLAMVVAQAPGSITPLPDLSHEKGLEKAFLESLETEIIINGSDSEKIKELKARVISAREDMKRMIDKGMTFAEVLNDYQKRCNEESDIRMDTARELQKIIEEGDLKGARKYITTMNLALQQMGIETIRMPKELKTENERNVEK